jgi:GxxExxY protein
VPITCPRQIRRLSQAEFGPIAYAIMAEVFAMHRDLGGLFHERIYQQELARRLGPSAASQVPLYLVHRSFRKTYFLDIVADEGVILELKAAEALNDRHRAQLVNYLFLLELSHGKLINVRSESVAHEFINTNVTTADRKRFVVDDDGWVLSTPGAELFRRTLLELVADWGLGLEMSAYAEALAHLLGGEVDLPVSGTGHTPLGTQRFRLAHPRTAFRVTTFRDIPGGFAHNCRKLLRHLPLESMIWANLAMGRMTLRTLERC